MSDLAIVPVGFDEAADFIRQWHRTHPRRPAGQRFAIGVARGDLLVGVAWVGRPVAKALQDGWTVEVNRTCTDQSRNANSMLYGAAWRAAKGLGYCRATTYTQDGETGASLRAAGWVEVARLKARPGWGWSGRPRDDHGVDGIDRFRWEVGRPYPPTWTRMSVPAGDQPASELSIFDLATDVAS